MSGSLTGGKRVPRAVALKAAQCVVQRMRTVDDFADDDAEWVVAGSIRRGAEKVGDVDLLLYARTPEIRQTLYDAIAPGHDAEEVSFSIVEDGVQVDVLSVPRESWGAALMHFTGPWQLNVQQRRLAVHKGWLLNQYGLYAPMAEGEDPGTEGPPYCPKSGKHKGKLFRMIAGRYERDVYAALGVPFLTPEERQEYAE